MVCFEFEPKIMDDSHIRQTNFKVFEFCILLYYTQKDDKILFNKCGNVQEYIKSKIVKTLHDC
jgi:hypothetical protein